MVGIVVQARMGSSRFPGKVLLEVKGCSLLEIQLRRLQKSNLADRIIVATTESSQDDALEVFCKDRGFLCFRGSEPDVLSRYYLASKKFELDTVVRVTADCPLIDPEVIDQVISCFQKAGGSLDYVSNTLKRTYPRGMDTEVFSMEALERSWLEAKSPQEREHVTPYLYSAQGGFRVQGVECDQNFSHHRWTVDQPEDFDLIKKLLEALSAEWPTFKMKDVLNLLEKNPEWIKINQGVQQK